MAHVPGLGRLAVLSGEIESAALIHSPQLVSQDLGGLASNIDEIVGKLNRTLVNVKARSLETAGSIDRLVVHTDSGNLANLMSSIRRTKQAIRDHYRSLGNYAAAQPPGDWPGGDVMPLVNIVKEIDSQVKLIEQELQK
jgi:hypothetical protein